MTTLTMSLALILTIILSLAVGIGSGYVAIIGILHAFQPGRPSTPNKSMTPALAPSGD